MRKICEKLNSYELKLSEKELISETLYYKSQTNKNSQDLFQPYKTMCFQISILNSCDYDVYGFLNYISG